MFAVGVGSRLPVLDHLPQRASGGWRSRSSDLGEMGACQSGCDSGSAVQYESVRPVHETGDLRLADAMEVPASILAKEAARDALKDMSVLLFDDAKMKEPSSAREHSLTSLPPSNRTFSHADSGFDLSPQRLSGEGASSGASRPCAHRCVCVLSAL